jgi:sulfite reductase alpha subunit-like flavoprotein
MFCIDHNTIGDIVTVGIEKGLLEQPPSHSTPIICVGPGTGVAPMRALIEERILHSAKGMSPKFYAKSKI